MTIDQVKHLVQEFGSPLYVYDESILRERCKEVKALISHKNYIPNYSAKANTNLELLKIIKNEGFTVDAMSPGEIVIEMEAGFSREEILFISNNISREEMMFAIEKDITISVDSLSQLRLFGRINPGGRAAVRLNPGIGAGHNKKVVTGGKSKFGIELTAIPEVKEIAAKYNIKIVGIDQHIGSLFLDGEKYIQACKILLDAASEFYELQFIDFGGGLGVPYEDNTCLNMEILSKRLNALINDFIREYPNKDIQFKIEPGRYIVAECGELLGTVHSVKVNYNEKYIGTDIGFNTLIRPVLYDSYHEIAVYNQSLNREMVNVTGNICESGDLLAKNRELPEMKEGDILGIKNAGAYGYSMASNYNSRLRPAEVLIQMNGDIRLIRRRDTYEDLLSGFQLQA